VTPDAIVFIPHNAAARPDRPDAPLAVHALVVVGAGRFPLDMLRYDQCVPATPDDTLAVASAEPGARRVRLLRFAPDGVRPSSARWASFGWRVVEG
jgi:hypothetical protein